MPDQLLDPLFGVEKMRSGFFDFIFMYHFGLKIPLYADLVSHGC